MSERSKEYNNTKLAFDIFSIFYNLIIFYFLGFSNVGQFISNKFFALSENRYLSFFYYLLFAICFISVLNLFISYYTGFYLEKKYELSNETFFKWIKKYLKGFLISLILGVIILEVFYMFLIKTQDKWWIFAFVFFIIFNILIGMLAPVIILPLFYKFTDLENKELKEKIMNLAKEAGVKVKGIYKFDMSKETKKANAAFTGIGKTKRIIIGDTLLDSFDEEEILSVFAHEMGHLVKKHIIKMMIISSLTLFVLLYIVSYMKIDDYNLFTNIFKVSFLLMIMQNFTMVFDNAYSRKNEKEADLYAKEIMGNGDHLISALQKLEKQNLSDKTPNKIVEFIFYSHPSVNNRIKYLK